MSKNIKYIPIMYSKCPKGNEYEPLFDIKAQITEFLKFSSLNYPLIQESKETSNSGQANNSQKMLKD